MKAFFKRVITELILYDAYRREYWRSRNHHEKAAAMDRYLSARRFLFTPIK